MDIIVFFSLQWYIRIVGILTVCLTVCRGFQSAIPSENEKYPHKQRDYG